MAGLSSLNKKKRKGPSPKKVGLIAAIVITLILAFIILSTPSGPAPEPEELKVSEVLSGAVTNLEKKLTSKESITGFVRVSSSEGELSSSFTSDITVDLPHKKASYSSTVPDYASGGTSDESKNMKTYIVDGDSYSTTGNGTWTISTKDTSWNSGLFVNYNILRLIQDSNPEITGAEKLGVEENYIIEAQPDFSDFIRSTANEERVGITEVMSSLEGSTSKLTIKTWISKSELLPSKTEANLELSLTSGDSITFQETITSNYGLATNIELPLEALDS